MAPMNNVTMGVRLTQGRATLAAITVSMKFLCTKQILIPDHWGRKIQAGELLGQLDLFVNDFPQRIRHVVHVLGVEDQSSIPVNELDHTLMIMMEAWAAIKHNYYYRVSPAWNKAALLKIKEKVGWPGMKRSEAEAIWIAVSATVSHWRTHLPLRKSSAARPRKKR